MALRYRHPGVLAGMACLVIIGLLLAIRLVVVSNQNERWHASLQSELKAQVGEKGSSPVARYYRDRAFAPVWFTRGGALTSRGESLLGLLQTSEGKGLAPDDYRAATLAEEREGFPRRLPWRRHPSAEAAARFDARLTTAYFAYAHALSAGRIPPEAMPLEKHVFIDPKRADPAALLDSNGSGRALEKALDGLEPQHVHYQRLTAALHRYREIEQAGGWEPVPELTVAELTPDHPGATLLEARLRATDDWDAPAFREGDESEAYRKAVSVSLRHFQERHGLVPDGTLSPRTLAALNRPVREKIDLLRLNLDRWRWLPRDLGERYLFVNLPEFRLRVYEGEDEKLAKRVIIGKDENPTPLFSDEMTTIVFAPYWLVPRKIVLEELLPQMRKDPAAFAARGFELVPYPPEGGDVLSYIDARDPNTGFFFFSRKGEVKQASPAPDGVGVYRPDEIAWGTVSEAEFPFRVRQKPGEGNALGRVKFLFPNEHAVYIHDTPTGSLFDETRRGFSHGCVRLEDPLDLAEYLLADEKGWDRDRIEKKAGGEEPSEVRLEKKIPVYMVYATAFVEEEDRVIFAPDVYGHDEVLLPRFKTRETETARRTTTGKAFENAAGNSDPEILGAGASLPALAGRVP